MKDDNDIAYFELLQDLPGCPAGSSFTYVSNDSGEYIFNGPIQFPAYFVTEHPKWFKPIYMYEYRSNFKKSFVYYAMNERGCSKEEAEHRWELFLNDPR
jgi:hypothetical protein